MGHPRLGWWLGVASWLHVNERLVSKTWYIWVFRRENASRLFTCLLWVQNGSMPNHHNLWSPRSWILHHTGSHVLTVNIWIEHTIVNLLKSDPFRNSEPWAQAVDEIAFLSVSASQWLLGELHVAATAWKPEEPALGVWQRSATNGHCSPCGAGPARAPCVHWRGFRVWSSEALRGSCYWSSNRFRESPKTIQNNQC